MCIFNTHLFWDIDIDRIKQGGHLFYLLSFPRKAPISKKAVCLANFKWDI